MNCLKAEAKRLVESIQSEFNQKVDIVISPSFTVLNSVYEYISSEKDLNRNSIQLAAQDIFWENGGAYTGEISPVMLTDVGCSYVIIGHSERRKHFAETNQTVNKKIFAAIQANLKCIICVGETIQHRENNETYSFLESQVKQCFSQLGLSDIRNCAIAYEPIWAIGTGQAATPDQADQVHQFIRKVIKSVFGDEIADEIRILYGGSVTPENALELLTRENIDGVLVGSASIKNDSFNSIIEESIKLLTV